MAVAYSTAGWMRMGMPSRPQTPCSESTGCPTSSLSPGGPEEPLTGILIKTQRERGCWSLLLEVPIEVAERALREQLAMGKE